MTSKVVPSLASATNTATTDSIKLLIFEMGKLYLALPVARVQKVTKYGTVHSSGLNHVGITHLGDREITIVDLHKKLFHTSQVDPAEGKGYFIITQETKGEALGIVVAKTPTLLDVPFKQVRILPDSYRRADTLAIASHVAVIPQENDTSLTLFILDVEQLI